MSFKNLEKTEKNEKDFMLYCRKHKSLADKYQYISVTNINEVIKLMLE